MDQSIWAARGPDGEAIGAVVQPLPTSHCIFRAPNSAAGKCWMDALELALRCSSLLLRTMASSSGSNNSASNAAASSATENLGSVFNRLSSTSDSGSVCEVTLKGDKVIDDMRAQISDLEDDFDDDEEDEEEEDEDEDSVNGGPSRRITTDSKYGILSLVSYKRAFTKTAKKSVKNKQVKSHFNLTNFFNAKKFVKNKEVKFHFNLTIF